MIWHTHEWKVATNWWNGDEMGIACVGVSRRYAIQTHMLFIAKYVYKFKVQPISVGSYRAQKKNLGSLYGNIHIPVSIERELLNEIKFHLLLDRFFRKYFWEPFVARCSGGWWWAASSIVFLLLLSGCLIRVCHSMIFASHAFSLWRIFHLCARYLFIFFFSFFPAHGPTDRIHNTTRFG